MPSNEATQAPFGSVFAGTMALASWKGDHFGDAELVEVGPLDLHPGSHVLHYGSTIFEGLKAYRGEGSEARIFRLDRHVERMRHSAELLCLPVPAEKLVAGMIIDTVTANRAEIPLPPGSLYLRPTLIGTQADVGAAAVASAEGYLYVLACPVGDYFAGGLRPLRIVVETEVQRSTPGFGMAKTGGNYAAALRTVLRAKAEHHADQVLFAPAGDVQETGAANFILLDDERLITKPLDGSFLHGVTRDSILQLAGHLGYTVEERNLSLDETLEWIRHGEAALSGTAAVLAPIGTLIHDGTEHSVGDGGVGPNTVRLRQSLIDTQLGKAPDRFGWITTV